MNHDPDVDINAISVRKLKIRNYAIELDYGHGHIVSLQILSTRYIPNCLLEGNPSLEQHRALYCMLRCIAFSPRHIFGSEEHTGLFHNLKDLGTMLSICDKELLCTRIQNFFTADEQTRASANEGNGVLYGHYHLHLLLALNVLAGSPFQASFELSTRAAGMRSPHALEILCDNDIRIPSTARDGHYRSEIKFDFIDDITYEEFKALFTSLEAAKSSPRHIAAVLGGMKKALVRKDREEYNFAIRFVCDMQSYADDVKISSLVPTYGEDVDEGFPPDLQDFLNHLNDVCDCGRCSPGDSSVGYDSEDWHDEDEDEDEDEQDEGDQIEDESDEHGIVDLRREPRPRNRWYVRHLPRGVTMHRDLHVT